MSRLPALMASYGSYHRNPLNRLTHFFGVPTIVFAVLVALSFAHLGATGKLPVLAIAAAAATALYYMTLDVGLGIAIAVIYTPMVWGADQVVRMGHGTAWAVFGVLFVGGWVLQLLGHRIEGNRPALLDNLHQTLVAPIFLAAEAGFALGLHRGLRDEVERLSGA